MIQKKGKEGVPRNPNTGKENGQVGKRRRREVPPPSRSQNTFAKERRNQPKTTLIGKGKAQGKETKSEWKGGGGVSS